MFTIDFWKTAFTNAAGSVAVTVLSLLGGDQFNLFTVDVAKVAGIAGGALVISLLGAVSKFATTATVQTSKALKAAQTPPA